MILITEILDTNKKQVSCQTVCHFPNKILTIWFIIRILWYRYRLCFTGRYYYLGQIAVHLGHISQLVDVSPEEIPDTYKTVKKKGHGIVTQYPHGEHSSWVQDGEKKVMVKPPATRKVEIPAVYKTVGVRNLVSAPKERRIPIPAEYQTAIKNGKGHKGSHGMASNFVWDQRFKRCDH